MRNHIGQLYETAANHLETGLCRRCQGIKLLNIHGLCPECDHLIDEEYALMYQEPLEH